MGVVDELGNFIRFRKRRPLRFWRSRGVFEGWGLQNGQFSPDRLMAVARGRGCRWVAVQDSPADRQLMPALKRAAQAHGLQLVVWQSVPTTATALECIRYWGVPYIAEVERRTPEWPVFAATIRREWPQKPLGIITNFWGSGATPSGYDRSESDHWIRNRWACLTEAYTVNEDGYQPGLTAENLDWTAKAQLGYPETFPAFGIYRVGPDYYDHQAAAFPNHSWYMAEYLPEAR